MAIFKLESSIRNYDWGTDRAISDLLGREPGGQPEAELWMGAHTGAPSALVDDLEGQGPLDLKQLLESHTELLGPEHRQLPYLFKVLAAASPLSLQVHPSAAQAREGFQREEREGIPLSASHRCYKDDNHKPELIMALSPFFALCGFVPPELMSARLEYYGFLRPVSQISVAAERLHETFSPESLRYFFSQIFEVSRHELEQLLEVIGARILRDVHCDVDSKEVIERSRRLSLLPRELKRFSEKLLNVFRTYPGDPGLLAALMLHWVELRPGQAMYLPAGVLHSYLEGVGLEIMASSDNVLRGGLTSKYVSVEELQRTLGFSAQVPQLVAPRDVRSPLGAIVTKYDTPAPEFELSLVALKDQASFASLGPDLLLVLQGEVEVRSAHKSLKLTRGEQVFCSGDEAYFLVGNARIARASPNSKQNKEYNQ